MFRSFLIIASLSQLLISFVQAHGYVSSPPSRAFLCKQGNATDCGQIQYEPQSVEAPKGLPFIWDGDGKLCSAGLSQFSQLDRQGPGVWSTTLASPVSSFNWTLTAPHATTDFKYFITKQGWNSSTTDGLYADDFDSDPFLVVPMHGQVPLPTLSHNITKLPQRSGYQVVFAVWTIDNTANAFYQCLDLDFGESSTASTTASQSSGSTTSVTNFDIRVQYFCALLRYLVVLLDFICCDCHHYSWPWQG
ncbi:hypothetical protein IE53DRAFT_409483 [Violaceomyces palustris]|uniref:Uncharacterized protein n=1 Tax=Violaceomyces palustris TaxID=1673888 RepID=A0ACD0P2Y2_9BASI|nr:hypothetical protein IE53DRAFT_409483 [Violaceomyces palustris]